MSLQGAPVVDVADRVRGVVVDEQPVLQVLAGVGEVQTQLLELAARAGVLRGLDQPYEVAAQGRRQGPDVGVPADPNREMTGVHAVVGPQLEAGEVDARTVPDEQADRAREGRRPGVLQHDGRPGERADLDDEVPERLPLTSAPGPRDHDRRAQLGLGGNLDHSGAGRVRDGEGGDPVHRGRAAQRYGVRGADLARPDRPRRTNRPVEFGVRGARRTGLEQPPQPLQRREAPHLFPTGGPGMVGEVVRGDRVQVRRDGLDGRGERRGVATACRTGGIDHQRGGVQGQGSALSVGPSNEPRTVT